MGKIADALSREGDRDSTVQIVADLEALLATVTADRDDAQRCLENETRNGGRHLEERIWKLESELVEVGKRNAELAEIAESLFAEIAEPKYDVEYAEWYTPTLSPHVIDLRDRLLNPRASTDYVHVRDRDALLAAVSTLTKRDERIVDIRQIPKSADGEPRWYKCEWQAMGLPLKVTVESKHTDEILVALLVPSQRPNPDLLERASTLLAEAYIAAKKEGQ